MQAINNVEVSAPSPFSTWREFLIVTIGLNSMKEEYIINFNRPLQYHEFLGLNRWNSTSG